MSLGSVLSSIAVLISCRTAHFLFLDGQQVQLFPASWTLSVSGFQSISWLAISPGYTTQWTGSRSRRSAIISESAKMPFQGFKNALQVNYW